MFYHITPVAKLDPVSGTLCFITFSPAPMQFYSSWSHYSILQTVSGSCKINKLDSYLEILQSNIYITCVCLLKNRVEWAKFYRAGSNICLEELWKGLPGGKMLTVNADMSASKLLVYEVRLWNTLCMC